MKVFCPECGRTQLLSPDSWRCECLGAFEPATDSRFDLKLIEPANPGLWRYANHFQQFGISPHITLGAGVTPLLRANLLDRQVFFKTEFISPTGSFKDRGTEVEVNWLANFGVSSVIEDSSGNAGSSLAAYAARAGWQADIFVPHYTSQMKQRQIETYGATIHAIPGVRNDAKLAALEYISTERVFASHAYHPAFLLGMESLAWEVWEQLGGRAPDWCIIPVGQGVQLLGVWLGFCELKTAGLIDHIPHMVAVQPNLLNPISFAITENLAEIKEITPTHPSLAEGLAIARPVRWKRVLRAIRESGGLGLSVSESEIIEGQAKLAQQGLFVEPTSAVVYPALLRVLDYAKPDDVIMVSLTGSGLKGVPTIGTIQH